MDERDILVFTDEEGQEIQMEILDYFEYDDQLYAMLIEAEETIMATTTNAIMTMKRKQMFNMKV